MGISVQVNGQAELERYQRMIDALGNPAHKRELLETIGAVAESQTRRRITTEKTAPDGTPWQAWSASYAKTRHGNQSLLQGDGPLLDSIQYQVKGSKVHLGSPLPYAPSIQDGFKGSVNISAHTRRITQAFGKALKFPVNQTVSAFTRAMNMPQREFLGLSGNNKTELLDTVGDFWSEVMRDAS